MVANRKGDAQFIKNVSPRAKLQIYYFLFIIYYLLSIILLFVIYYLLSFIFYLSISHSPAAHHTILLIFAAKFGDNLAFRQLHFACAARIIEA